MVECFIAPDFSFDVRVFFLEAADNATASHPPHLLPATVLLQSRLLVLSFYTPELSFSYSDIYTLFLLLVSSLLFLYPLSCYHG